LREPSILSIFINNPRGDNYCVNWCLYDPGKIKKTLGDIPPGFFAFPKESKKLLVLCIFFDENYEQDQELFVFPELL